MLQDLSNAKSNQISVVCPPVPPSIMTANRDELDGILRIDGTLPDDLQGHVFFIAPVGTINSGGLPFTNGGSFLNGDGMVYRLDFNEAGKVKLKTRIVKPSDYLADELTQPGTPFARLGFRNYGILRFSFFLGARNELNTAFLPMKFPGEILDRLLVTYDAGRPYEIDTDSLEVVTPIGSQKEWRAALKEPTFLFKPIFSTAHPAFDAFTGEMFAVNYGRSIGNFIDNIPFIQDLDKRFPKLRLFWEKLTLWGNIEDFVYLIRWNGKGNLERWKLVLPDGSPIRIEQTIHQIGISQDYIVLMDTSFATGIEQLLNNPFPNDKEIEEYLRKALEISPLPDSHLYIVRRADLKNGQIPAQRQQPDVEVQVRKVIIPLEAAHFLMDYANPDDKITLHISHICAWDVAEWIRSYDKSAHPPYASVPTHLPGMEVSEMDISRLGRYVIDGKSNDIAPIEAKIAWDPTCTWGTGLYAYRDRLNSGMPPKQLEDIYWISFGLWDELVTQFLCSLYKNYKHQQIPQSEIVNLAKTGKPACLFRLHTPTMEIVDCYEFPSGYIVSSPQFMPRKGGDDSSTNGYIICTVFFQSVNEIWVFEAWNLQQGPKCKLSNPSLKFAFTLHTAWLPTIGSRQASYKISAMQDHQNLVETLSYLPKVEEEDEQAIAEFLQKEWLPFLEKQSDVSR